MTDQLLIALGLLGAVVAGPAYLMLMLKRVSARVYAGLNLLSCILAGLGLYAQWNLGSCIIESFYAIISIVALALHREEKLCACEA